jgi:hypothetical protein
MCWIVWRFFAFEKWHREMTVVCLFQFLSWAAMSASSHRHLMFHGSDYIVVFFVLDEQHGEAFRLAVCAHVGDECARHEVPFFGEEAVDLDVEGFGATFYDKFLFHGYDVLFLDYSGRCGLLVHTARTANARQSREKVAQDG